MLVRVVMRPRLVVAALIRHVILMLLREGKFLLCLVPGLSCGLRSLVCAFSGFSRRFRFGGLRLPEVALLTVTLSIMRAMLLHRRVRIVIERHTCRRRHVEIMNIMIVREMSGLCRYPKVPTSG